MLGDPSSWSHSRPHHLALLRTGPILGSPTTTLTAHDVRVAVARMTRVEAGCAGVPVRRFSDLSRVPPPEVGFRATFPTWVGFSVFGGLEGLVSDLGRLPRSTDSNSAPFSVISRILLLRVVAEREEGLIRLRSPSTDGKRGGGRSALRLD